MQSYKPSNLTQLDNKFMKSEQKSKLGNGIIQNKNLIIIHPQINKQINKDLQERKLQIGCANKLCPSYNQQYKDVGVQICMETLCDRCKEQFQKDSFCIYCKQIYFDETDDGKEWIMCESCSRWVHSQCADFNTKQNANALFQCIKCKKIQLLPAGKRNIPRTGYAKLQKRKNNQFLNSIGFEWQLSTNQVSQDMQSIRKYLG